MLIVLSNIKGKKVLGEKFEVIGGKVASEITKNINLLIVGSMNQNDLLIAGSMDQAIKMYKANAYGIDIMSQEDFEKKYLSPRSR